LVGRFPWPVSGRKGPFALEDPLVHKSHLKRTDISLLTNGPAVCQLFPRSELDLVDYSTSALFMSHIGLQFFFFPSPLSSHLVLSLLLPTTKGALPPDSPIKVFKYVVYRPPIPLPPFLPPKSLVFAVFVRISCARMLYPRCFHNRTPCFRLILSSKTSFSLLRSSRDFRFISFSVCEKCCRSNLPNSATSFPANTPSFHLSTLIPNSP